MLTPLNITVTRLTQDGMLRKSTPTTVMVPLTVPVDAGLMVHEVPLPAVMVVPAAIPVPAITCPMAIVPVMDEAVSVVLAAEAAPVNDVVAVDTEVPCTIF